MIIDLIFFTELRFKYHKNHLKSSKSKLKYLDIAGGRIELKSELRNFIFSASISGDFAQRNK